MIEKSETIAEIAKALVKFNSEVSAIKKDSVNPFFNSSYASLSSILDGIYEPLQKNGLSIAQMPDGENNLTTLLIHESGEYIQSTYHMKPEKATPQGFGSCITYQRRYALGGILNLNIDDDTDGNSASAKPDSVAPQNQYDTNNNPWLNDNTPEMENATAFILANKAKCSIDDLMKEIRKKNKVSKDIDKKLRSL
jgi:hypothetical protein